MSLYFKAEDKGEGCLQFEIGYVNLFSEDLLISVILLDFEFLFWVIVSCCTCIFSPYIYCFSYCI